MTSSHKPALRLLVILLSLTGLLNPAKAQWTFSFELSRSGPCTAAIPTLPTFTISSFANKSQCEYVRSIVLATRACGPVYNNQGKYIGDCCVFYTCTACTGSDINTSSQVTPGEVTFNAQFEGQPFFTTHQSSAFEDWAKDYKQLLESYGITSILGKDIIPNMANGIPLTNDPKVNALYGSGAADFNPDIPDQSAPHSDPNVVDLSGSSGVVSLLTTPEAIQAQDAWLTDQGIGPMETVPDDGLPPLDESNFQLEEGDFWTTPEMTDLGFKAATFLAGIPAGALGYGLIAGVGVTKNVLQGKSAQETLIDVGGDLIIKGGGDAIGYGIGKVSEAVAHDFSFMMSAGGNVKDIYELWKGKP